MTLRLERDDSENALSVEELCNFLTDYCQNLSDDRGLERVRSGLYLDFFRTLQNVMCHDDAIVVTDDCVEVRHG